jgi:hypothetical protein
MLHDFSSQQRLLGEETLNNSFKIISLGVHKLFNSGSLSLVKSDEPGA